MKFKVISVAFAVISLAIASWAMYVKHQTDQLVLSMLYLDSVTHIKNDLYILSSLREGRYKDATTHLERLLDIKAAILAGCKYDLCAESMPNEYSEILKEYKKYKGQQQ